MDKDWDLMNNVILFSQTLRKRNVGVTIDNVVDAAKGISLIDLQKRGDFYHLLRANFVSRKEEMDTFDELFEQFWFFDKQAGSFVKKIDCEEADPSKEREVTSSSKSRGDHVSIEDWSDETGEDERNGRKELLGYSPDEVLQQTDFAHFRAEELEKVKYWVSVLSRKIATYLSRRWQRNKNGNRLDFGRSIRQSLKYGGEILELKMKERKLKPLRLILVCDVSGSMDIYSHFFLRFMHALQNHYPYCETFAFSTRLSHLTSLFKGRTFEQTLHLLSRKALDWSGGTNIGASLHELHQHHSNLLHPNRSLLLIFSDGWDRGDTLLLDNEMKNLKRHVKKLIWLNPLLGHQNYQPLCKGMSTALPHLNHFLPYYNWYI
jgi:uncharacterized protein with von Willebrand factor type A (vWA) domain